MTQDEHSNSTERSGASYAASASSSTTRSDHPDDDNMHHHFVAGGDDNEDVTNKFKIAEREDKIVFRMKVVLVMSLVFSATAVALASFFITGKSIYEDVDSKFQDAATELLSVATHSVVNVLNVMEDLAITTTAQALRKGSTWPNYTAASFEQRVSVVRESVASQLIAFNPIVLATETEQWNEYSQSSTYWIFDSLKFNNETVDPAYVKNLRITVPSVHGGVENSTGKKYVAPMWQTSLCPSDLSIINYDMLTNDIYSSCVEHIADGNIHHQAVSSVFNMSELFGSAISSQEAESVLPESFFLRPVFTDFSDSSRIVGYYSLVVRWSNYIENVLQEGVNGIFVVLSNTCGQEFTYEVDGPNVTYLGEGSLQGDYSLVSERTSIIEGGYMVDNVRSPEDKSAFCDYFLTMYAGDKFFDEQYDNSKPLLYLLVVFIIFVSTSFVFVLYDVLVTRRQNKVLGTAARTHQIVGSLFPDAVRDQILKEQEGADEEKTNKKKGFTFGEVSNKAGLRNFFSDNANHGNEIAGSNINESKPIADLFLNTTIMFADITGFTAWSSVREPSQVFTLLETVFHGFDQIARARRVFKVETVGDCYVAVAGLPDPRHDHAVVMVRFARDCLNHMNGLVTKLALTLGPGTEDLTIRVGLHSGPVTAGVLRGERARFQLFGDTMNTAARMETTGKPNRIHFSQETANLLTEANKSHWFQAREDIVVAKGKGALQTFWLVSNLKSSGTSMASSLCGSEGESDPSTLDEPIESKEVHDTQAPAQISLSARKQRLVDWNVELLLQLLKKVVARRDVKKRNMSMSLIDTSIIQVVEKELGESPSCLKDIVEIIEMPTYRARPDRVEVDPRTIELSDFVKAQVRDYVGVIASMYHDNPFHCFEHASHVTMSVSKLLGRIVAPDAVVDAAAEREENNSTHADLAAALHDHTYGITSDPLTQFAVVLSGLIHDVDHRGVPNFVLAVEEPSLAMVYNGKSVAEQNSVNLAWRLLMEPRFEQLRNCIYEDESELCRFRHLIVNSVMATDIFDKDLGALRKSRWNKAFYEDETGDTQKQNVDRKATIVIEHLIQASDVAHTMQHWHVYQKWNALLFEEMYKAYIDGRTQKDPAESWYQGEIGFFDNYVIPLAKKLKECGVFGVSSDEYLNYAMENRREWEKKGMGVVEKLVEKHQAMKLDREL